MSVPPGGDDYDKEFDDETSEQETGEQSSSRMRILPFEWWMGLEAVVKKNPNGPFSEKLLRQFAELEREQPEVFARLCERYPALAAAVRSLMTTEQLLAELNRDYCVVKDGGKTLVLSFEEMEHAAGGERYVYRVPTYMSFRAFTDFYLNRHIMAGKDKPKWVDVGTWWLSHRKRRQYSGVIFKPGDKRDVIDGKLNLWTGWGVEPKPVIGA
jgi:hypothetical protein